MTPVTTLLATLGRLLPSAERDELLGDVEELYARDAERRGRTRAGLRAAAEILRLAIRVRLEAADPDRYRIRFETRKSHAMDALTRDIRYAFRTLGRTPGFTFVVILMLALGIGSNTAIFSLLDQRFYRSLPVHDPDALVQLDGPGAFRGWTWGAQTFSYPMYRDFVEKNDVFAGVIARYPTSATLLVDGRPERVQAEVVSGNFFEVLGVQPAAGRLFSGADEQTPRAHPVVVLSHGFWERRFGGDASVVGRSVTINNMPMTVVGVSPKGFHGVSAASSFDIAVPVMMKPVMTPTWDHLDNRRSRWLSVVARLAPGVTVEQARAQMAVIFRQANELEIAEMQGTSESFRQGYVDKALLMIPAGRGIGQDPADARPMLMLMAMVGLVLLIACANIANLILARSAARRREVAVRLALGASRATLVRQQLVESGLLALTGGAAGIGLAVLIMRGLLGMQPATGPTAFSVTPDARLLLFALGVSMFTAILFGLGPALTAGRSAVVTALKDEGGAVMSGRGQMRVRKGLVVAQVALSMLLVAAGGLFARSLQNLHSFDPGFEIAGLSEFAAQPSLNGYSQPRIQELLARVQRDAAGLPGVRSASMATIPVMDDSSWSYTVSVEGYQPKEGEDMNPDMNQIGPRFFETLAVPVIAGREFEERDRAGSAPVAVVNESFQRYFFGNESAVGRRVTMGGYGPREIVGVVRDMRSVGIKDPAKRGVFLPIAQQEDLDGATFYLRTARDASAPGAGVRDLMRQIDPALPVYNLRTLEERMRDALYTDRLLATLSAAFGVLATLLAAIGLYGVMSYAVARRRKEIGVRMALGADGGSVQRMVLGEISVMAAIGIVIGLAAALGLGRMVRSALFGLSPMDPIALAGGVVVLSVVIFFAGWVPARKASRIEPLRALRSE